jgi:uncharacterized membrane protein
MGFDLARTNLPLGGKIMVRSCPSHSDDPFERADHADGIAHDDFIGTYLGLGDSDVALPRERISDRPHDWLDVSRIYISTIGTSGARSPPGRCAAVEQIEYAAGIMAGSYIGGGINFFAVKESYQVSTQITYPLLVADNFVMAGLFIVLLWIAGSALFRRHFPHPHSIGADGGTAQNLAAEHWHRKGIALIDIAKTLAVAFAAVGLAELLRRFMSSQFAAGKDAGILLEMLRVLLTNKFVLITAVSLCFATLFHGQMTKINGPEEIGGYLLYLFLFVIGLPADLRAVLFNVPLLFVFCLIISATNLVFTLAVGKLIGFNLEELLLCVNATVGGPPTAAAMAISTGWSKLVLPGLLVGIWGYVIGTALGVLVTEALLRMYSNQPG